MQSFKNHIFPTAWEGRGELPFFQLEYFFLDVVGERSDVDVAEMALLLS